MRKGFVIELTDSRFFIDVNEEIIGYIRYANPSAHSDVGSLLFDFARRILGARAYCPIPKSFTYVVLHTAADHICAIATGQRALSFKLAAPGRAEALANGAVADEEIGPDWVQFDTCALARTANSEAVLLRCAWQAFGDATAADAAYGSAEGSA